MESKAICCNCSNKVEFLEWSVLDNDLANYVNIPPKSIYFHLNEKILYDKSDHDYSDKNVLLVGCGSIKRTSVLRSLKLLSFNKFVCLTKTKLNWALNFFDDWILADHKDLNQKEFTLEAVEQYQQENNIKFDAILTYDDYCVLMTSYITSSLNLVGIPYDFIEKIKNKYIFRSLCSDLKINCPQFYLIKSNERKSFLNRPELLDNQICVFPVIVKNANGSGKDFVKKCSSLKALRNCIQESLTVSNNIDLIVEEFMDGVELDIDILIQNNEIKFITVSDNFPSLEPSFHELGCMSPSIKLCPNEIKLVKSIITNWLSKMNFQNAILHFEAKFNAELLYDPKDNRLDSSLMPIEINSRLGGCETWSNVKASYGVDLIREYLNICLGYSLEIVIKDKADFRCISRNFLANTTSLESVSVNLEKLKVSHCVEVCIFKQVGEKLEKNENVGWITVKSDYESTESQLIAKLEKTLKNIKIDFNENFILRVEE